jgi:hypothetical protein
VLTKSLVTYVIPCRDVSLVWFCILFFPPYNFGSMYSRSLNIRSLQDTFVQLFRMLYVHGASVSIYRLFYLDGMSEIPSLHEIDAMHSMPDVISFTL